MKKVTNFLLIAAIFLGFAACNKEEVPAPRAGGKTYVGVNLAFPGTKSTRALPEDYNKKDTWQGRDEIKKITVYVVNESMGTVNYTDFGTASFEGIDANGFLKPTLAVQATAGHNVKVYAVVNDMNDKTAALKNTATADFDRTFKELEITAVAAEVATCDGGTKKETVMMTNKDDAVSMSIEDGVSQSDAINGVKNRANVEVSRVASRGIVTIGTSVMSEVIKVKNANGEETASITLKEVTYAVGQSNKKFYNMHRSDWKTPENAYSFVPSASTPWLNNTLFDYADLVSHKALQSIAYDPGDMTTVKTALAAEDFSKFVLPVTHADNSYRKGNTTYFEIRCTFVPDKVDGVAPGADPSTVYLGMQDGKFYSSREKAQQAVAGQKAMQFKNGVMKYVLWLNPNKPYNQTAEKITMSPTVRNQVYHAHISGFKEIGVPNNPLHPDDPDDPNDPENPDNPIDPDDPLQTDKTYMSVSITVVPWTIHSYGVNIGNEY